MRIELGPFLDEPGRQHPVELRIPSAAFSAGSEEVRVVQDVVISGRGFSQMRTLYLDLRVSTSIERPCGRCLMSVSVPIDAWDAFELPIPEEGDTIDLRPSIVAIVVSSLPSRTLCREDCRGLCPKCGADLNRVTDHRCDDAGEERRTLGEYLR